MSINNKQSLLLFDIEEYPAFPSTRFQGSKLKLINWIWDAIKDIQFKTALDAFGGTGSVAYMLKSKGKQVTYNDILKFNWYIGLALIENSKVNITKSDIDFILTTNNKITYPSFIEDTFKDIYFTSKENHWIDMIVTNIHKLDNKYKQAMAYFALFQSCIIKRPFNLFHRKNLYLRFSDVKRSFGNKITWDTPFETHFIKFIQEANSAIFSNNMDNQAINCDVFDIKGNFDLVYIDTPYISKKGVGVDYHNFYHFLEGLVDYSKWEQNIDYKTKNKRLKSKPSPWSDKKLIHFAFDKLFNKYKNSILVVSYRSDGIPSIDELFNLIKKYKTEIEVLLRTNYKYVLSNNHSDEVLIIAK